MSRRKRYIESLTIEQKEELEQGYKKGATHDFRLRCQSILLSYRGKSVPELQELLGVTYQSLYAWFNRWESEGIEGLKIRPGRGRKPKLSIENIDHVKTVKQALKKENRTLNQLRQDVEAKIGQSISKSTLRSFLKDLITDTAASDSASNPSRMQGRWVKK